MSDLLTWSPIPLGRWFGTSVRVHVSLIAMIALTMLASPFQGGGRGLGAGFAESAAWLALYLLALAVHEAGHALAARATGCESGEVRVWPLGSLAPPSVPPRDLNQMATILAGPFVSGMTALTCAAVLGAFWDCQFAWRPLGNGPDAGAPWLHGVVRVAPMTAPWLIGWFGFVNYWLLLANLLPAPPFDGGRLFRWFLANASPDSDSEGEGLVAPWTARAVAAILFLIGLARLVAGGRLDGFVLVGLALLVELMVRSEARVQADGGYFDDNAFGQEFPEGYAGPDRDAEEADSPREGALTRWRRRRSELRRQRRILREVAEERRMDEILDKIYHEGKAALTDEENRFLVRVSRRFRDRQNTRD